MSEEQLSIVANSIYIPSVFGLLGIIFVVYFFRAWLPKIHGMHRVLTWLASSLLAVGVFIATFVWALTIGGCLESCMGKIDDEMGMILAGLANWTYIAILFLICFRRTHKNA